MSTQFNSENIEIVIHKNAAGEIEIECEEQTLPAGDPSLTLLVAVNNTVATSIECDVPNTTIEVSHLGATGQELVWSGNNPCNRDLGVTGGFIDVVVEMTSDTEVEITIIPVDVKPTTSKPFGG